MGAESRSFIDFVSSDEKTNTPFDTQKAGNLALSKSYLDGIRVIGKLESLCPEKSTI